MKFNTQRTGVSPMQTKLKGICLGIMMLSPLMRAGEPIESWTMTDTKVQGVLTSVAYGAGQYVAVGSGGTIVTSPDATSWTERKSGTTASLLSIVYGDGQFIAVGGDELVTKATVVTSKDGFSWSLVELDLTNVLRGVTYGAGLFVAVGGSWPDYSIILSSEDGIKWETRLKFEPNSNDATLYTTVAYGNGVFLALAPGSVGVLQATSSDGITWTRHRSGIGSDSPSLAFGNGVFVAVGGHYMSGSFGDIWTSKDGLEWEKVAEVAAFPGSSFMSIAYGGGQFLAVGDILDPSYSYRVSYRSSDGRKWIDQPDPGMKGVDFGNGKFIGVAGNLVFSSGVIGRLGASVSPSGQFEGTITGVTGQTYAIQASTNLATWSVLTNVAISNGVAQFSESPTTSRRFYGAMLSQ
jgi:hypothetical protein